MAIRIVIADDHSVVRRGLRMFLAMDPELIVVGEAADGEEAVHLARLLLPDIVLMDLLMPVMDGITATAVIRGELPDTEVLALTSVLEDASVVGAVRAGAIGYLLKDTDAEALCRAIKAAAAGQVQLTPQAAERLMQVVKHARASRIELRLQQMSEVIILEVCDNGRGFGTTTSFPGHLGLHSMQERVRNLGGELQIESAPGQGTCIRAEVPSRGAM